MPHMHYLFKYTYNKTAILNLFSEHDCNRHQLTQRWGMLVNPKKTKALVISRSRTLAPIFPNLVLDGSVVERVTDLKVFGIILDTKLSFESHISSIAASASSKLGIRRKALCLLGDPVLVSRCFWSFLFPVLVYS